MKKPQKISIAIFIIGLITTLTGAYIMFHGSIFAENNSGIATVIGIVGIGLIATSNFRLLK
jgi:uncharacterized membrane protein